MNKTASAMPATPEDKQPPEVRNRRVHMANERTFLAWIRTSIGIMAFGFVVEKFALFIKRISYFLEKSGLPGTAAPVPSAGGSSIFGIMLVGLGAALAALAFARYKQTEKQINLDTYQPSLLLDLLLTIAVLAIGMFLIIFLIHSIS